MDCQARGWARKEFGHAELGDARRTERLVRLASRAIARPGGRITEVCESDAERQGAYDFLESDRVGEGALQDAAAIAAIQKDPSLDKLTQGDDRGISPREAVIAWPAARAP
jgi:hypothetical protein